MIASEHNKNGRRQSPPVCLLFHVKRVNALFPSQLGTDAAADIAAFGGANRPRQSECFSVAEDIFGKDARGGHTPSSVTLKDADIASDAERGVAGQYRIGKRHGESNALYGDPGILFRV